jgi:pimeloyl-ACP methyl ester carboxylesterase
MNVYVLDLRERAQGGAVTAGHLYDGSNGGDADGLYLPAFTALTRGREVVVLIHGYNNTRREGRDALLRFAGFLDAAGVTAVMLAVLWPGDGWAKALTYPFEGKDADDSADALLTWITTHVHPTARVSLVAHSLGCRVAMNAAQQLADLQGTAVPALRRVCLMAAAVDNDCLGRTGSTSYRDATLAAEQLAVLASEEDRVLGLAYPLGDLLQTVLYFGDRWGTALGLTGVVEQDPVIVAKLDTVPLSDPARAIDHGHYLGVANASDPHTIAQADEFVASFLTTDPPHTWRAGRP